MRNQQAIKLFLVLIISTIYIFSFSHFGARAYDAIVSEDDHFGEGTMIGSVLVEGKTANEALRLVDEQLTKWLEETTIIVHYKEKSESFDLRFLTFEVESSVLQAKQSQQNPVIVNIQTLDDLLTSLSSSLDINKVNMDELQVEVLKSAKVLEPGSYNIRLEDYLEDSSENERTIINESSIPLESDEILDGIWEQSIEIGAKSKFSLLDYIGEQGIEHISSVTLGKLATSIYEVILPTNFSIIERHISNELPSYASLGIEAKGDVELNYDLVIYNPNEISYFIEFEKKDGFIFVYLKGTDFLNKYEVISEDKESFTQKTIRQFNPQLKPNEIVVKTVGKEGQIIKVYREHRDEKGELLLKELISEDFYPPIHRVEVQGIYEESSSEDTSNTDNNVDTNSNNETEDLNSTEDDGDNIDSDSKQNSDGAQGQNNISDLWGKPNEQFK